MNEMSFQMRMHAEQPVYASAIIYLGEELTDPVSVAFFEDCQTDQPAETVELESWEKAHALCKVRAKHHYFC